MTKKKEIQELGGSKSEDIEMSDSEEDCIEAVNDQERTEVGEAIEAEQNDRPAEKDPRARTVFVKNLPSTFIAKNVTRLFKRYGRIDAVKIRGLKGASEPVKAYILFQSLDSVAKALKLNKTKITDHTITVQQLEDAPQDLTVYVGNLSEDASQEDLRELFADCGDIRVVGVKHDTRPGKEKCYGFIEFDSKEAVDNALKKNGGNMMGKSIEVTHHGHPLLTPYQKGSPKKKNTHRTRSLRGEKKCHGRFDPSFRTSSTENAFKVGRFDKRSGRTEGGNDRIYQKRQKESTRTFKERRGTNNPNFMEIGTFNNERTIEGNHEYKPMTPKQPAKIETKPSPLKLPDKIEAKVDKIAKKFMKVNKLLKHKKKTTKKPD